MTEEKSNCCKAEMKVCGTPDFLSDDKDKNFQTNCFICQKCKRDCDPWYELPIKFRYHRGTLKDSLDTQIEITDTENLIDRLNEYLGFHLKISDIKIEPYGFDARIGWDTHIVTWQHGVLGFLSSHIPGESVVGKKSK